MSKCEKCGKTDFDDGNGCFAYAINSPAVGDWLCIAKKNNEPVKISWQAPQTAPKDRMILACFGYPWPFMALFSAAQGEWAGAQVEHSLYEGMPDPGFVTEYFAETELLGWVALPAALPPPPPGPRLIREGF